MTRRPNLLNGLAAPLCLGALVSMALFASAFAASHEQIIEMCRQSLMPQLHECVVGKVGSPRNAPDAELQKAREQCGAQYVRPCVLREEQRQSAGTPAPAAPKEDTSTAPAGVAIQPTFVAPPRTIADITAILDSEKPDAEKIAKRKADADATPPSNASGTALAEFYIERGNARALLARNKDALADGLQALAVAGRGVESPPAHAHSAVRVIAIPLAGRSEKLDCGLRVDRA